MSEIPTSEKVSLFLALQTEHDDCGSGQHNCDENAICTNTVQGHSCTCKPGYVGNGTICRGRLVATGVKLPMSCLPAWAIGAPVTGPLCASGDWPRPGFLSLVGSAGKDTVQQRRIKMLWVWLLLRRKKVFLWVEHGPVSWWLSPALPVGLCLWWMCWWLRWASVLWEPYSGSKRTPLMATL